MTAVAEKTYDSRMAQQPSAAAKTTGNTGSYPLEQWWVAALGSEVSRKFISRWIADRPVLLYRRQDGSAVAIDNRCVHRSFPLSDSWLEGDNVVCGYHGFTYQPDGKCVRVPSGERVPPRAKVHSYPIVEKGPFIWIWTGAAENADESLIPETTALTDPGWTFITGHYNIGANYLDLHENLLDLTHFSYLHAGNIGTDAWASVPVEVEVVEDVLRVNRVLRDNEPPNLYANAMNVVGHRVDRHSVSTVPSAAIHLTASKIVDLEPAGDRTEYKLAIIHAITPESEDRLHQFWALARDFAIDDESVTETLRAGTIKAFEEDVVALNAITELKLKDGRKDYRQVSTTSDKAGHQVHKLIRQAIERENTLKGAAS